MHVGNDGRVGIYLNCKSQIAAQSTCSNYRPVGTNIYMISTVYTDDYSVRKESLTTHSADSLANWVWTTFWFTYKRTLVYTQSYVDLLPRTTAMCTASSIDNRNNEGQLQWQWQNSLCLSFIIMRSNAGLRLSNFTCLSPRRKKWMHCCYITTY